MIRRIVGHFVTITTHKIKVMKLCFRCGLYKQGLLHDLSKYSFVEFSAGVKYYQGFRSPISLEKEIIGYSKGWLHHKGRNKHHFEYWMDHINGEFQGVKMEKRYLIEMFCDRIAACQVYQKKDYHDGSALEYFKTKNDGRFMHPQTAEYLEMLLTMVKDYGLEHALNFIKKELKVSLVDY